jgi:hypothetical protein
VVLRAETEPIGTAIQLLSRRYANLARLAHPATPIGVTVSLQQFEQDVRIETAILASVGYPTDSGPSPLVIFGPFEFTSGLDGADASQTGMGRKTEFSRVGLHRMRMGVQSSIVDRWQFHRGDEDELRTAARQGVRISCLCRAPRNHKESRLVNHSQTQMLCDFRVHLKQLAFKEGY